MFAPAIAFFAWLAFPPRGSLPRLEVSRSRIRVVPGLIARRFAETAVEINLYPTSRDILLCHSVWKGLGDGLRLVVRDGDGTERQIRATSMDYLTARKAQKLAQGISDITGLPVQLLTRIRQADGRVRKSHGTRHLDGQESFAVPHWQQEPHLSLVERLWGYCGRRPQ